MIPLKTITWTKVDITPRQYTVVNIFTATRSVFVDVCTHFTCILQSMLDFRMCGWNLVSIVIFSYRLFSYLSSDFVYQPFGTSGAVYFSTYFVTQYMYIHNNQVKNKMKVKKVFPTISLTFYGRLICQHLVWFVHTNFIDDVVSCCSWLYFFHVFPSWLNFNFLIIVGCSRNLHVSQIAPCCGHELIPMHYRFLPHFYFFRKCMLWHFVSCGHDRASCLCTTCP
jgi:hypothetical protein